MGPRRHAEREAWEAVRDRHLRLQLVFVLTEPGRRFGLLAERSRAPGAGRIARNRGLGVLAGGIERCTRWSLPSPPRHPEATRRRKPRSAKPLLLRCGNATPFDAPLL